MNKMDKNYILNSKPVLGPALFLVCMKTKKNIVLFFEIIFIPILALTLIKIFQNFKFNWLLIPFVLIFLPFMALKLRKKSFKNIGLYPLNTNTSFKYLFYVSLVFLPLAFIFFFALNNLNLMHFPTISINNNVFSWISYQLFYVAVSEEIFFRGYLIRTFQNFLKSYRLNGRFNNYTCIFLSSLIFGIFHIFIAENAYSFLTFFPALIFGWLFIRTKSLVAPILFHGICNIFFAGVIFFLHNH